MKICRKIPTISLFISILVNDSHDASVKERLHQKCFSFNFTIFLGLRVTPSRKSLDSIPYPGHINILSTDTISPLLHTFQAVHVQPLLRDCIKIILRSQSFSIYFFRKQKKNEWSRKEMA